MPSDVPQFPERTPIDAGRSWTAAFDSYDERKLDLYYVVTLHEGDRPVARFVVCVFPWWNVEDWCDPAFRDHLRKDLHDAAATGRTNTAYEGSVAGWMAAGGRMPLS